MNLYACSVCFFGDANDLTSMGLTAGIISLFCVLFFVLGIFIKFFLGIRKRERLMSQKIPPTPLYKGGDKNGYN